MKRRKDPSLLAAGVSVVACIAILGLCLGVRYLIAGEECYWATSVAACLALLDSK